MSNRRKVRGRPPRTDWSSSHLGEHVDCGCVIREVHVLEVTPCQQCGSVGPTMIGPRDVIPMATGAERGSLWNGYVSCSGCDGERAVVGEVL